LENRSNKISILIVDDVHQVLIDGLINAGFNIKYFPDAKREDILNLTGNFEGLVIRTKTQIDTEIFNVSNKLKFIARAGSGMDNIDIEEAERRGVICFNAGEANSHAVGEHALGMLLCLFNKICQGNSEVKNRIWEREQNRGIELNGKKIGIVGFGNTGKAFAKKLSGFDVEVMAYDKYLENYGNEFAKESSMNEIFSEADIISFHVPLTSETKYLVNSDYINSFKKNIFLLNLSRGSVVKTADLINSLKIGKIMGCALDVLENENIKSLTKKQLEHFNYLCLCNNVILTPHVAGWTVESYRKISEVLLNKIVALIR